MSIRASTTRIRVCYSSDGDSVDLYYFDQVNAIKYFLLLFIFLTAGCVVPGSIPETYKPPFNENIVEAAVVHVFAPSSSADRYGGFEILVDGKMGPELKNGEVKVRVTPGIHTISFGTYFPTGAGYVLIINHQNMTVPISINANAGETYYIRYKRNHGISQLQTSNKQTYEAEKYRSLSPLEQSEANGRVELKFDISGNYVADISSNRNDFFGNIDDILVFALEQNGDRITAVNSKNDLKIGGTRKGNIIEFFVEPHPMNYFRNQNGVWVINPDGINITGSWEVINWGVAGQWNLRRVE